MYQNNVLSVFPVLSVKDVDEKSGDIFYDGSVYVSGSVYEGRTIEAKGNVVVGGVISNCNIKAGGHLVVGGGSKGGEGYTVTVGGSFRTPFIEYLNANIKGDVYTDVILGGDINCFGAVYAVGKRGRIAGTRCIAKEITANELGNSAGAKTRLEISYAAELEDRIESLRKEAEGWRTREIGMRKIISETGSNSRQEMLKPIYTQIVQHQSELEKEIEKLERKFDAARANYAFEIRSLDTMHPNVSCMFNGKTYVNENTFKRIRVYYIGGFVQMGQYYGNDPY